MLQNVLQRTGQLPTTKNHHAQNVSSAATEKLLQTYHYSKYSLKHNYQAEFFGGLGALSKWFKRLGLGESHRVLSLLPVPHPSEQAGLDLQEDELIQVCLELSWLQLRKSHIRTSLGARPTRPADHPVVYRTRKVVLEEKGFCLKQEEKVVKSHSFQKCESYSGSLLRRLGDLEGISFKYYQWFGDQSCERTLKKQVSVPRLRTLGRERS